MLRRRITQLRRTHAGPIDPNRILDSTFWDEYIYFLTKTDYKDMTGDPILPNPKKYSSNSSAVKTLESYFDQLNLPVPSSAELIALLKSPFSQGDLCKVFVLARFFQLSEQGFFITIEGIDKLGAPIHFQGSENWENVMCYLDATMFAMFANLDSFEQMLFVSNLHPQNSIVHQLSVLLRVYVNLIRSGNLVTTDITLRICHVLARLGFTEALSHRQQDAASLFEFLTEVLSMPMLTFKVNIKHAGKFNKEDDQKFTKERILFVSLPEENPEVPPPEIATDTKEKSPSDDNSVLLEECLELYFNNSIVVKRELERRMTLDTLREAPPGGIVTFSEDSEDFNSGESSPVSPLTLPLPGIHRDRKSSNPRYSMRTRSSTLSIWSLSENDSLGTTAPSTNLPKEVSLPAWMFLKLLPFYTDDDDTTAANVKEFANRRPILPICLKNYSFNSTNSLSKKSDKRVIIPPFILLPQFVADDPDQKLPDNFRLVLESAVFHRGASIHSGHFVSAIRKNTKEVVLNDEEASNAAWLLYDDMKKSGRAVEKTFDQIFEKEWPYLLFYRLISDNDSDAKLIVRAHGSKDLYWNSETAIADYQPPPSVANMLNTTALSPILSASNSPNLSTSDIGEEISNLSLKKELSGSSSVPLPDVPPTDSSFIDIRDKYFWYVTDEDRNYVRELTPEKNRREPSFSIPRRNSRWSQDSSFADELSDSRTNAFPSVVLTKTSLSGNSLPVDDRATSPKTVLDDLSTNANAAIESRVLSDIDQKLSNIGSSSEGLSSAGQSLKSNISSPAVNEISIEGSNIKSSLGSTFSEKEGVLLPGQGSIGQEQPTQHHHHHHHHFHRALTSKNHSKKRNQYKKEKCIIV